jgi:hypothetical protein
MNFENYQSASRLTWKQTLQLTSSTSANRRSSSQPQGAKEARVEVAAQALKRLKK